MSDQFICKYQECGRKFKINKFKTEKDLFDHISRRHKQSDSPSRSKLDKSVTTNTTSYNLNTDCSTKDPFREKDDLLERNMQDISVISKEITDMMRSSKAFNDKEK